MHNPGGTLHVSLADDEILLRGPVHRVASVVVDPVAVLAGARPDVSRDHTTHDVRARTS